MGKNIVLTSGDEVWGSGATKEAAIADAIASAFWFDREADEWREVTREWIDEQLSRPDVCGHHLYFSE